MPTFPDFDFAENYSHSVEPAVQRTAFASGNSRQRFVRGARNDVISVVLELDNSQLALFRAFVEDELSNGADAFEGYYQIADGKSTGPMQIIEGRYDVRYLSVGYWAVSYEVELLKRDFTQEQNVFEVTNAYEGFEGLWDIIKATEDAVNNNNL